MTEPIVATEQQKRELRRIKYAIWIMLAICAVLGAYVYIQGLPPPPHKYDALAQCIAQSSTTFYGAFWCPHCEEQKTKFGTGAQYLPYVECSLPNQAENATCTAAGIVSYPTWQFKDGSRSVGVQTPAQLAAKTGCVVPTSSP
jgi:thiol-disulfide isomerase/thioredoxin